MTQWRAKKMALADWSAFQDRYTELFMNLGGHAKMALFIQGKAHDELETLLIPAYRSELAESLSPGGWEDHPHPTGPDISLLVGNANSAEDMNVMLGQGEI